MGPSLSLLTCSITFFHYTFMFNPVIIPPLHFFFVIIIINFPWIFTNHLAFDIGHILTNAAQFMSNTSWHPGLKSYAKFSDQVTFKEKPISHLQYSGLNNWSTHTKSKASCHPCLCILGIPTVHIHIHTQFILPECLYFQNNLRPGGAWATAYPSSLHPHFFWTKCVHHF